jgi:cytoskeletal protein CcmA (bactofilin family)
MAPFRPSQSQTVFVGAKATLNANLSGADTVIIDGEVNGEIDCALLVVGPEGVVNGQVRAEEADIAGRVGPVLAASQSLLLRANSQIFGEAIYGELEVEKGAVLKGARLAVKARGTAPSHDSDRSSRPHGQRLR